jgi:mannose-1-phosphate guanylyltransferase
MKAMLLAGGLGERLRPVTDHIPKCLVRVDGVPLLGIWLDLCARHGVTEVLVNISRHAALVREFLEHRRSSPRVTLVEETSPRGNAGTVRAERAFVEHEESFLVLYSDNLTTANLTAFSAFHRSHTDLITMGVFRTAYPQMAGIVTMGEGNRVTRFEEKPRLPEGDLANAGIYALRHAVLDRIPDGAIVDFAHDVFPRCDGLMRAFPIEDYLLDIGHPAALARAQVEWPQQRRRPETRIEASR